MRNTELERAYRASRYWVDVQPERFYVEIDERDDALAALMHVHRVSSCGFVTAWNPHSRRCSRDDNDAAQQRLERTLHAAGYVVLRGYGAAADGSWAETMCIPLAIDRERLVAIGRDFGQNAVVHAGEDAIPRLIWVD